MNRSWSNALKLSADPARAKHIFDLLAATSAGPRLTAAPPELARVLTALFSGSQPLSRLVVAHPDWLEGLGLESLKFPRRKQGLRSELNRALRPLMDTREYSRALGKLREFKQREMLRIGARDLAHLGRLEEILQEISDVADVSLENVWQICYAEATGRYGHPYHQDAAGIWQVTPGCVLGMGKLGGQELNYSSDVDLLFVYGEEGEVYQGQPAKRKSAKVDKRSGPVLKSARPVMPNHQFFKGLAEAFIAEVARLAPEGTLYRIDMRLRPEGEGGPLCRSIGSYENYYSQWGQTWERMMLIKARGVAGDETLAAEFLEMLQPFRYPRSINPGVLGEVGAMKDRIENEIVKADELERNVKLGRGGIREIEFIAQSLQLLHAGRQPFLQGAQTLPCLEKLVQYELLPLATSRRLREAYVFLREVEHRLQMEDDQQTHTIPVESGARQRLARLMSFSNGAEFEVARSTRTGFVRQAFRDLFKSESPKSGAGSPFPQRFEGAELQWKNFLAARGFKEVDKAFRMLREFVEGPGFIHVSQRTSALALQLLPKLFALCPHPQAKTAASGVADPQSITSSELSAPGAGERPARVPLSDPDRVVTRLDSFISAYGARATLFELWARNPTILELLLLLFDRSEFLAELSIRTPDLVDELVTSGRLRQSKQSAETLRDLRHGLADADQPLWLRKYHQAELMRIGLRDILGLADFEQHLTELSALADACLQYALEVVMRKYRLSNPPFVILGLGKLGGMEIDYGSDLDLLFIADSKAKNLARLSRPALEVMDLLSRRTEQGILFHTDARLRPDGEKGLLVNTLRAYEDYYRTRAQLWEIQSLTRVRPVAGDSALGNHFLQLAAKLTNFSKPSSPLAAYAPDWRQTIHRMRMRIEQERTPRGQNELAIKTGAGGLMDAEFVAQSLCLQHGWHEPNTLRALQKGRAAGVLPEGDKLIENYRRLRRVEGILRRWSYEGETVLPVEQAPYYRVSIRCGFPTPEAFREALAQWRADIRQVYSKVMGAG